MFWSNPPTVNFTHENHSSCFDQIPNYQFFTWESLIMLRSNPQLSIFHMRITWYDLIKSSTVKYSHENHLFCFDQISSCQFFTWESLVMLWSNPHLSIFHMRITCYALIKSPSVNLYYFDQIPICQFILLWSNPHLSIYITLIKSPTVNFSHENHLYYFDQIPTLSIFHMRITYITLIKSPDVNFSHENHLYYFDQIPTLSIFHIRITYHALIKSTAVHSSHENHLLWFDQILSCQIFTWESLIML